MTLDETCVIGWGINITEAAATFQDYKFKAFNREQILAVTSPVFSKTIQGASK